MIFFCAKSGVFRGATPRWLLLSPTDLLRKGLASCPSVPPSSRYRLSTVATPLARHRPYSRPPDAIFSPIPLSRRRAFSSYDWKNMSKYAQEANKEFSKLTPAEVRKAGEDEVDKVEKALRAMEPFNDVFTVRREGLEVFAELGPQVGTYWIKFDLSIKQICMMSPRSGPHRYIYDKGSGRWIGEADKHDFQGMLTRDIIQSACGIPEF